MTTTEMPSPQGDIEALAGNQYKCKEPGCDRSFPSPNGLQGHMIAHRPAMACPECGKEYKSPGALGNHRKHEHGVASMHGAANKVTRQSKTFDWEVDDIIEPALREIYPGGSVPIGLLPSLMRWREATQAFLEKAQTE